MLSINQGVNWSHVRGASIVRHGFNCMVDFVFLLTLYIVATPLGNRPLYTAGIVILGVALLCSVSFLYER